MEPEWNYGIMEPAQTTARVRDQDGTGQDGQQDRTGQDKAPVATGPQNHRSRTRTTGKRVSSCVRPSTRGLTGVEGPRFDFGLIQLV